MLAAYCGLTCGHLVLDAHQRHVDARYRRADRGVLHQLDAGREIVLAARNLVDAMRLAAVLGPVAPQRAVVRSIVVVVDGGQRDRHPEARVRGDVVDALAVPVGDAAVAQALDILLRRFQSHGDLLSLRSDALGRRVILTGTVARAVRTANRARPLSGIGSLARKLHVGQVRRGCVGPTAAEDRNQIEKPTHILDRRVIGASRAKGRARKRISTGLVHCAPRLTLLAFLLRPSD